MQYLELGDICIWQAMSAWQNSLLFCASLFLGLLRKQTSKQNTRERAPTTGVYVPLGPGQMIHIRPLGELLGRKPDHTE